ncbi:Plasmodium exported protein (PHIST), unknown function [Plasmodium vivax]|uniref:Plasmodium RESA N-terminal domain-containing protein n=1 Tax=Plasmodium vivax TaxID=5855 RepID=A0A1G4H9A1_PLAVI|nr:Plasmodium exported protein (PHIST), unknown function [Plasmodium vivax]VUZ94217.1 Plasmodium exported protein (PHIST), unknown function [Plasmodium vivax]
MSYSSSESLFVRPKIYHDQGRHVQTFYDDDVESFVERGGNRRNMRSGGGSVYGSEYGSEYGCEYGSGIGSGIDRGRGSKNVLSKFFTLSLFSSLLSSSPSKSIMGIPNPPQHQINAHHNYSRGNGRRSSYLRMVDHLKNVRGVNGTDAALGGSYSDLSSVVSSNEGSSESIDLGSEISSDSGSESTGNLSDGSLADIEIGEEVFEDSILTSSNYEKIKSLKYDKVIEDDEVPFGCKGSDFTANMTKEDIIESIKNLSDPVPFKDMFIVYNSFHENERKKFKMMQNVLKNFLENVAKKKHLRESYVKDAWTHISSYMTQELLRKDFVDFKSLYELLENGECSLDEYVHFIKTKKSSWNFFLSDMEDTGRDMIYDYVTRRPSKRREQSLL